MNVISKCDSGREVKRSDESRCPMAKGKGDKRKAKERGYKSRIKKERQNIRRGP